MSRIIFLKMWPTALSKKINQPEGAVAEFVEAFVRRR